MTSRRRKASRPAAGVCRLLLYALAACLEGVAAMGVIGPSPVDRARTGSKHQFTQIRRDTAGKTCYQAKRAAGKSHKEALRCLNRRLADVVYRTMIRDTETSLLPTRLTREEPLDPQTHMALAAGRRNAKTVA